ncbi:MAG: amino acid ABC transporter permease [Fusobacteriaceae bacterium]
MLNNLIYILKGLNITLGIYLVTVIFSLPLGIILALGKNSKYFLVRKTISAYSWIFRGTPLLLQLFFVYYGLPVIGITMSPFLGASITFIINYTAYLCEIFRGSIQGIDEGQYEAAKVLGMGYWQTMYRIILPQALRTAIPPLSSEAVTLVKDTALVSVIGMAEILRNSKEIVSREFTITPFLLAGGVYLVLSSIILLMFRKYEKKVMNNGYKNRESKKNISW